MIFKQLMTDILVERFLSNSSSLQLSAALVYLIPQGNSIKMILFIHSHSFIQVFPVLLWKHSPSLKPPTEHCEPHTGLDYVLHPVGKLGRQGWEQHVSPGQKG